jgi:hypothetical protein
MNSPYKVYIQSCQEVTQSAETTPNETKVISSNLTPSFYVDIKKKKKKRSKFAIIGSIIFWGAHRQKLKLYPIYTE